MNQRRRTPGDRLAIRLATAWLIFVLAFALGWNVHYRQAWPHDLFQEIAAYFHDDGETLIGVADKVQNDLGLAPKRHIADLNMPFTTMAGARDMEGLPLSDRREKPRVFLSPQAPRGYRVIYGTFDFVDTLHGAILLDPDGEVRHVWPLTQQDTPWASRPDRNVTPHAFDILPDGSVVAGFDGGNALGRYDDCGRPVWRIQGGFHHSATIVDGVVWAWGDVLPDSRWGTDMVRIDVESGEVLDQIGIREVIAASSDIDVLSIRQFDGATGSTWLDQNWHANDIDPLPEAMAAHYPQFQPGDLLLSFRSVDLVTVVDPTSHRVKWWRQGLTRRQHDPDWNTRGTITVFDNNMHRMPSRIVEIDPESYAHRTLMDSSDHDFYTWHRGVHQEVPGGGFLVTSTEQGRVFETGPDGEIVFEFVNDYQDDGSKLVVTAARFLDEDFFGELPDCR